MNEPLTLSNFKLYELVNKRVIDLLGDNAWSLFNSEFVKDVDRLVSDLKKDTKCTSCIVNDWQWGGGYTQSGFREADSDVGATKSQHRIGNALDLKFVGITIDEALNYLVNGQDKYPFIKRYEMLDYTRSSNKYGGWLHLDGELNEPTLRGIIP